MYNSITIAYSTRQFDRSFYNHIKEQSNLDNQIIYKENKGEFGLTELYNSFLHDSENEITVIIHDDVILPKGFEDFIESEFCMEMCESILDYCTRLCELDAKKEKLDIDAKSRNAIRDNLNFL